MRRLLPSSLIPLLIAAAVVVAALFLRQFVLDTQQRQIRSETQTYANALSGRLEAHVLVRLGVMEHLRQDWARIDHWSPEEFRTEVLAVHDLFEDLQALNWVSPDGIIEIVTPMAGNEAALGLDVTRLEAPGKALAEAGRTGDMRLTPPIVLAQGGTGFVAYIPVRRMGRTFGYLNIVFRAQPLIRNAAGLSGSGSYDIWVYDQNKPLFEGIGPVRASEQLVETTIEIGGRTWHILTLPTAEKLAASQSRVDEIVLFAGILAAVLIGLLSQFAVTQHRSMKESEERFALAMQGSNDGLWDWDFATGKTYFSPRWSEMLGYRPGELASNHDTFVSLLHPDDRQHVISYPQEMIANDGEVLESEFRMRHKAGHWINILSRAFLVRENGRVERIVGTHVDITERRAGERALQRAQQILREGLEALPVGFAYFDSDQALLVFNDPYPALLSSQPLSLKTGMKFEDLTRETTAFARARRESEGNELSGAIRRWTYLRADGRWIEAQERVTESGGFVQVIEDVTEVRRHQDQLQQTHKMEAIGQLTGGIAHDFNNLLAVIMGNAELLQELPEDVGRITAEIVHATRRGAELTQRLLAFSRRQPLHPEVVDLSALISGMQSMLGRTLGETVTIETVTPEGLWGALADPGQVENAVLNLSLNARDAMPEGGVLTIECGNVSIAEEEVSVISGEEIAVGDYVVLSVRDKGVGMSGEIRKQAFEPFFTTKGVGEGSGLGLSMVYGFAQQSGGQARINSIEGQGTTVSLYLPRARSHGPAAQAPAQDLVPKGSGETILVIEDDQSVRKLVSAMLKRLGYFVISAENVETARHIVSTVHSIRLILSDVVLPGGVSGPEFAAELASARPDLEVVFMSGYPASELGKGGAPSLEGVLLNKPFGIDQLARTLSASLAA